MTRLFDGVKEKGDRGTEKLGTEPLFLKTGGGRWEDKEWRPETGDRRTEAGGRRRGVVQI